MKAVGIIGRDGPHWLIFPRMASAAAARSCKLVNPPPLCSTDAAKIPDYAYDSRDN